MYASAMSARRQVIRRNQNTARYQVLNPAMGPVSHGLFVALMLAIVGVMYLTQITKTTRFGYQVDELKNQRAALLTENQELEQEAARLQSLERVSQSSVAKGLEDVNQVEFTQ